MSYLLFQILICLLIAGVIGFFIGLLFSSDRCKKKLLNSDKIWEIRLDDTKKIWHNKLESANDKSSNNLNIANQEILNLKKQLAVASSSQPSNQSEKRDNLQLIKGIGRVLEGVLNQAGIYSFSQIASWSDKEISSVNKKIAFPKRIEREKWVEQAKTLAQGEQTEFAKRVKEGSVATSKNRSL